MQYKWKEATLLVSVLNAALGGKPPEIQEDVDWNNLFALAKLQKVEAMVCAGLSTAQNIPQEVRRRFETAYKKEITAQCIRHNEGVSILNAFELNGIDCVPLKGWVIQDMYPNPAMRYMCDMDILFKPEQSGEVQRVLEALGYTAQELGGNPEVYFKKPVMNIEMHKALIRDKTDHYATSWERVVPVPHCAHTFSMTPEDYYLFMVAHLHKHFVGGGTGVRSVCDIEIYLRKCGDTLNREYIENKLRQSELLDFEKQVCALCRAWFHDEPADAELTAFSQKLLFCGVFGTPERARENYMTAVVQSMPGKSARTKKLFYKLSLLFPKLSVMQDVFPVLRKAPFLLPVFWVVRGVRSVLHKQDQTKAALGTAGLADTDALNQK